MNNVEKMQAVLKCRRYTISELSRLVHVSSSNLFGIRDGHINPYNVGWNTVEKLAAYYCKGDELNG